MRGDGSAATVPSDRVGRVAMVMGKPAAMVEKYKMTLAPSGGSKGRLTLEWENTTASVDFTVK